MTDANEPGSVSRREERRRDRLVHARIDRENKAADQKARADAQRAALQITREKTAVRAQARDRRAKARAARRAARSAWLSGHAVDLLFVPIIVVPGVLAWTAMAAYGEHLYGLPGCLLPAFSEGGMWAFAAATTLRRRHHPDLPVWQYQAGTVTFAAAGAVLNFLHGSASGAAAGTVMAIVSVAGVTVHQLITAGPRRTAAGRRQARAARAIGRRERAARRAALKAAIPVISPDGSARLVYQFTGPSMAWPRPQLPAQTPPVPATAKAIRSAIEKPPREAAAKPSEVPPREPRTDPAPKPSRSSSLSHEPDAEKARAAYRKSVRDGAPLSDRALGDKYGRSRTWGASRIRECDTGPHLASGTG